MRLIQTIKNIWKIEDLRKRLITTFLFIVVYRFGCHVVLPGINPSDLEAMRNFTNSGLMQLLDIVLGWCIQRGLDLRIGYHALHHRLYRHPTSWAW